MSEDKKIYVGRGKYMFDGAAFSFSINMTRLKQEAEWLKENEHMMEFKGSNFLKFKVTPLKDGADQNGKTHKVEVDLWKPDSNKGQQQTQKPVLIDQGRDADELNKEDDIPF
jgi:hypothetical protein